MGSSHLLNKGLPLGKRLPFLSAWGHTWKCCTDICANIWAFVRLSYSILASPPPLPFLLPSSLLRFSLFPIIFHLSHSSEYNCLLSAFCCKRQYSSESRGYGPLMARFINCINLPELERLKKKHTHYPLWKIWGVGKDMTLSLLWPSRTLCSGNVASSSGLDLLPNFALFERNSHFRRVQKRQYLALGRIGFFRISLK